MSPPLEKNVRGIEYADRKGSGETTAKAEPESGKQYGEVVETLKNIMQVVQVERRKVVEEADAEYGDRDYGYSEWC
jgi:hypothetical protein